MPRAATRALVAALSFVVVGCASLPYGPPTTLPPVADEPFAIDGRLSARHGNDAVSLAFTWTHASPRDEFIVSTPLGAAVAEMYGDTSLRHVEVRTADGRFDSAPDWAALTERTVGFSLPIAGLAYWVQGAPRSDAPHAAEIDAAGRAGVLRQDGCEIVYAYADDSSRRPSRLSLACHDLELRIVIDRWRAA